MNNEKKFDKEPRDTINPYISGLGLILFRMLWDLHPYSWKSRKRLQGWKNRFAGEKAVILCNGPSLNMVNLESLSNSRVFTFGLNKINLLFGRTDFRPSVIVAVNPNVVEQNFKYYNRTNIPLFIDSNSKKWMKFRNNVHFLHSAATNGKFAKDCSVSINQGHTVTYIAMQLAFHMGFKKIALVGCDHNFTTKGPSNKTIIAGSYDPNHFDPKYFANGVKWQLPDLTSSQLHYEIAKDTFERHNRKIINCTEGGNLNVFTRQPLDEFLTVDTDK